MFLLELIKVAVLNLARHKLRTALTMLGMIFGVAAVLAMLSIGAGAEQEALSLIEQLGLRNVVVRAKPFEDQEMAVIRQDSPGLSRQDVLALRQALPEGSLVVGKKQLKTYQVASALGRSDSRVFGVDSIHPRVSNLKLVAGAFFLPADETNTHRVCVLGTTARRKLFGLNDPLGEEIKINNEWFTVIGVLADRLVEGEEFEGVKIENPNNDIYVPLRTLLTKFESKPIDNELDEIVVQLPEGANVAEQAALISAMVASMHRQIDDFSLVVPEKLLQQNRQTQRIFNIVMGAIASISLLVGGIGIMNIVLATVMERTREIGVRRATGARRVDIVRQFLAESTLISIGGGLLGIAFGFFLSWLIATVAQWKTIVTPQSVIVAFGVSVGVGIVFGLYPAVKASRIDPIEALRYE